MKTYPFCLFIFLLLSLQLNAQPDCSHPVVATICPGACFINQTNAAMGDDAPAACNLAGNDVLYRVNVAVGTAHLFVSVSNASAALRLIVEHDTCLDTGCVSSNVASG